MINLNGKWQMRRTDQTEVLSANVPGSVYRDLLDNGRIPDPFYGDNEYEITKLVDFDYEYTRSFTVDSLDFKHVTLVCDGLDTLAEVYINENFVAKVKNMHVGYEWDVKSILKLGENTIRIVFLSPSQYCEKLHQVEPMNQSEGRMNGFAHLRKAHYMFGWDWGPILPDMGIWRDIKIAQYNEKIEDYYIKQTHTGGKVILDIDVNATSDDIDIEITSPAGERFKAHGKTSQFIIDKPMLWWHNGFGEHPLYDVKITLGDEDEKSFKIGLRTLTVNTEKDEWGSKFCFNINGKDIFAMGSNYIPEDSILSRYSEERTRKLLTDCVKANHNSIRVWGGGFYLPDYFYRICDELGLIVWHDFMFACGIYNYNLLESDVTDEIIYNVKRLRHHTCIALWCGNNEVEEAWEFWGWERLYNKRYKADYIKLFEHLIPNLLKELDPDRFYWQSSPSSGGSFVDPHNENCGDRHYWSVWHGLKPFTDYKNYHFRFLSEFGFQSFPCIETIKTFAEPEDMNIFSLVMESHQKNGTANEKILNYLSKDYRYPYSFEGIVYISQLMQAEAMRYGIEHFRRSRKNERCMGTLYWQTNDCWPVASWAGIDYYGRWKALHYKSKRFYSPLLLSCDIEGTTAKLCLLNETSANADCTAKWQLVDNLGNVVKCGEAPISADSLDVSESITLDFAELMPNYKETTKYVLSFKLYKDGELLSSECMLFAKPKHFKFADPQIKIKKCGKKLEITAKAFAHEIELKPVNGDVIFSDNYFSILPGEVKLVEMEDDIGEVSAISIFDHQK